MTAAPGEDLAALLTDRILEVEGVRGLFPSHTVAAAVLALAASAPQVAAQVEVDAEDGVVRVAARLATDRGTPSRQVIEGVASVVRDVLGGRPGLVRIELAHID